MTINKQIGIGLLIAGYFVVRILVTVIIGL
jgi:hypothetical protein